MIDFREREREALIYCSTYPCIHLLTPACAPDWDWDGDWTCDLCCLGWRSQPPTHRPGPSLLFSLTQHFMSGKVISQIHLARFYRLSLHLPCLRERGQQPWLEGFFGILCLQTLPYWSLKIHFCVMDVAF